MPRKAMTKEEKIAAEKKREERKFIRKVVNIFLRCGFKEIKTEGQEFSLGNRRHELDNCFIYENIVVICERTTSSHMSTDHILKKQETFKTILENQSIFLNYLRQNYDTGLENYDDRRVIIRYLYFSLTPLKLSDDERKRFLPLSFVTEQTLSYFDSLTDCIRKSARFEFFKYLNIKKSDIGSRTTKSTSNDFDVSILYPVDVTGYKDVRVASFMISPRDLIENGYVLRKDSWEESMYFYQRLITKSRISKIRDFVYNGKKAYLNNVIVSLPSTVLFKDGDKVISLGEMDENKSYTMTLKSEFNSIGIIDGQHRIFSFYENDIDDEKERIISGLRDKLNLLATGIIYPNDWSDVDKRMFESELFLEINKNTQKVKSDVIMFIEMGSNPCSDSSISREILMRLNNDSVLAGLFQISPLEKAPIKMTSIIKYALKGLVTTSDEQESLFKYWTPKFEKSLVKSDVDKRNEYVNYCTSILKQYFNAIKVNYLEDFNNPESMILKVISLNGLIIALKVSLALTNGAKTFDFYKDLFSTHLINFSKNELAFAGSRYAQFAEYLINNVFKPYISKNENHES